MKKITIALILCVCFSISAYAVGSPFKDVPEEHWAKNEIVTLASRGVVTGYTNGTFNPEAGVTREEFCKLLVVAFGHRGIKSNEQSFADVPKDRWSHGYVEEGGKYFTIEEKNNGKYFCPAEDATRAEVTAAIVKKLGYTIQDIKNKNFALEKFSDGNEIPESLLPYVSFALENGIVNGYTDGSFKPAKGLTRAEAVALLYRITIKEDPVTPQSKLNLEITSCPEKISSYSVTISGTVHDENDANPTVTVNGEKVRVLSGKWTHFVKIAKGENKIEIVATNKHGHSVKITKTVTYDSAATEEVKKKGGFAIVTKVSSARDENGEEITKVDCTKNEEQGFIYFGERARNVGYEHKLGVGDVFMYNTDKSGYVTDYLVIAERTSDNKFRFVGEKTALEDYLTTRKKTTELVLGFIENEKRKTNSKGEVIIVNGEAYVISSDTYKYTFDTAGRNKKIEISDFMYDVDYFETEYDESGEITGYGMACPVLLRIVNGEVVDVYTSNERVKTKID